MTVIETLLAETFGVPVDDPRVRGVVKAMDQAGVIDRRALVRHQIQNDPCRECKSLMRKYHVSMAFVYRSWRLMLAEPGGRRAELRPKDSRSR